MGDLALSGVLHLQGTLALSGDGGGKVLVGGAEVLVEGQRGTGTAHGTGVPVPLPPPAPTDTGTDVWIFRSFNATVTAGGKAVVTQGLCAQGNPGTAAWPGMVQASVANPTVTVNGVPANVVGDLGTTLPTGGPITFGTSGQS